MATPVGWVGLLIGGAVVIGTAAVTDYEENKFAKEKSGSLYDQIMKLLGQ